MATIVMSNNKYKIKKQQAGSILPAKETMAMLACFCFCTALTGSCNNRQKNGSHNLAKYTTLDQAPYNHTSEQDLLAEDYYDHKQCLSEGKCLLEKAVAGDQNAIKALFKGINLKPAHKTELRSSYKEATKLLSYNQASELHNHSSYSTIIKRLIEHKADLNDRNRAGETMLTAVILTISVHVKGDNQSWITLLDLLLQAGANPNCLNAKGEAPLAIVGKVKNNEDQQKIVALLIKHGANPLCASTNKFTEKYIRNAVINQLEKLDLSPIDHKELANVDAKLHAFFNEKYNGPNPLLIGEENRTCIACYKKEKEPTTIKMPSCGHYVHGSCLVGSLINQSKGSIELSLLPSYTYKHLCPCCKEVISDSYIKDLSKFYSGIKFSRKDITIAMHILLMIPLTMSTLHYLTPLLLL